MVLDDLGDSLKGTLKKIANAAHIDKKLIKEVVRDIQRALLQADVNVKLVLELSKKIEKRALQEKPPAGMSNREHVIHIVYEELVEILGDARELPIKKQIIMMVGLYGQGKTTTCGKLAKFFKKKGLRPVLIAGDVHRPAAYEQLKQIADQNGDLKKAATAYSNVATHLKPVWDCFAQKKKLNIELLRSLADQIRQAKIAEEEGLAFLKKYIKLNSE